MINFSELQEFVLVDFWAEWCKPCKILKPVFEALAINYPDVSFLDVNIEEQPEIAKKYEVCGLPTVILFKKGVEVSSICGSLAIKANIMNMIDEAKSL